MGEGRGVGGGTKLVALSQAAPEGLVEALRVPRLPALSQQIANKQTGVQCRALCSAEIHDQQSPCLIVHLAHTYVKNVHTHVH